MGLGLFVGAEQDRQPRGRKFPSQPDRGDGKAKYGTENPAIAESLKEKVRGQENCKRERAPKRTVVNYSLCRRRVSYGFLCREVELGATAGEVEHVNGALTFRVNQGDFDVTSLVGKNRADVKEQAGPVLGDKFQQRAVRRTLTVKPHARVHLNLWLRRGFRVNPSTQELFKFQLSHKNIEKVLLEPVSFRGIQLERAVKIDKGEGVQNYSGSVGKSIGFDDVHSPGGKSSGNGGKKVRPVSSDHSQFKMSVARVELHRNRLIRQAARQFKMPGDLLRRLS